MKTSLCRLGSPMQRMATTTLKCSGVLSRALLGLGIRALVLLLHGSHLELCLESCRAPGQVPIFLEDLLSLALISNSERSALHKRMCLTG